MEIPASVDRPIFLIGTGRCGLTLLMDLVACHEEVAWLSQYTEKWPKSRFAASVPYWWIKPVVRPLLHFLTGVTGKQWWRPRPVECFRAFDPCFRGFQMPYRPLTTLDVDNGARRGIRELLQRHVAGQRKTRFVADLSGYPRVYFLREIFPDARFVHVVRDARATVNSFVNVDWWHGWRGESQWGWGRIPDRYRRYVQDGDTASFVALAAVNYNMILDRVIEQADSLDPLQILHMRFEDLIHHTARELQRFCDFANLPYTTRFERGWNRITVRDPNSQKMRISPWRENLTEEQQRIITEICRPHLLRYRYIEGNS